MTLDRAVLDANVARVNEGRRKDQLVRLEKWEGKRFTLSFPNRSMPEGQCIDQDFTEIQWALHADQNLVTGIQGGRLDETDDRYYVDYECVEWD